MMQRTSTLALIISTSMLVEQFNRQDMNTLQQFISQIISTMKSGKNEMDVKNVRKELIANFVNHNMSIESIIKLHDKAHSLFSSSNYPMIVNKDRLSSIPSVIIQKHLGPFLNNFDNVQLSYINRQLYIETQSIIYVASRCEKQSNNLSWFDLTSSKLKRLNQLSIAPSGFSCCFPQNLQFIRFNIHETGDILYQHLIDTIFKNVEKAPFFHNFFRFVNKLKIGIGCTHVLHHIPMDILFNNAQNKSDLKLLHFGDLSSYNKVNVCVKSQQQEDILSFIQRYQEYVKNLEKNNKIHLLRRIDKIKISNIYQYHSNAKNTITSIIESFSPNFQCLEICGVMLGLDIKSNNIKELFHPNFQRLIFQGSLLKMNLDDCKNNVPKSSNLRLLSISATSWRKVFFGEFWNAMLALNLAQTIEEVILCGVGVFQPHGEEIIEDFIGNEYDVNDSSCGWLRDCIERNYNKIAKLHTVKFHITKDDKFGLFACILDNLCNMKYLLSNVKDKIALKWFIIEFELGKNFVDQKSYTIDAADQRLFDKLKQLNSNIINNKVSKKMEMKENDGDHKSFVCINENGEKVNGIEFITDLSIQSVIKVYSTAIKIFNNELEKGSQIGTSGQVTIKPFFFQVKLRLQLSCM